MSSSPTSLEMARERGLLIESIPIAAIDAEYLVRDRLAQDEDELASLKSSLKARGQQIPIEVIRLAKVTKGVEYGLISGWRRLTALRELHSQNKKDPRFAEVRAMVIAPETSQDAYLAMIEENEIRVNLSHYERARIALRAVHEGVFPDQRAALRGLYASSTRSKRSKIGTFMSLVNSFDGVLQHPTAISEKLGLALARETVRDRAFVETLSDKLRKAPLRTSAEEMRILAKAVIEAQTAVQTQMVSEESAKVPSSERSSKQRAETVGGISLKFDEDKARLNLTGMQVDEALFDELVEWLKARLP